MNLRKAILLNFFVQAANSIIDLGSVNYTHLFYTLLHTFLKCT